MPRVRRRTPTFFNTYPPQYATNAELKAEGLRPADNQVPAALFKCKEQDRESTSALYVRAEATPIVRGEPKRT